MSAVRDAIDVKKRGGALDPELIVAVVDGFTEGTVPDYQMSALLMAILLQGMSYEETLALTRAMADSGPRFSFPGCVDKHSTGGVGDKLTLTALPVVAACGAPVAKLSGRGLGATGGTIDKLESIPGLRLQLSEDEFARQTADVGLAIGEAGELAPADKAIYALRDATGTVDSIALIGSSVVSKKMATGAEHLLYDVKAGSGAFMRTHAEARELAELLVRLSEDLGLHSAAIVTGMDVPLGRAIGNALEVRESLELLRGEPAREDLAGATRDVARRLLELAGVQDPGPSIEQALASGRAFDTFVAFVRAQGGNTAALEDLPVSSSVREVVAQADGRVARCDALGVARAALALGAGRERKADRIDPGAGVEMLVTVGEVVTRGQPVARLYGSRNRDGATHLLQSALELEPA
jgi:pyrimidine-nucleoside phosphorylase